MSTTLQKPAGSVDDSDLEIRVSALEAGQQDINATIARLEGLVRLLLDKTDKLAADVVKLSVDVAELQGCVSRLSARVTVSRCVLTVIAVAGVLLIFVQ